MAEAKPCSILFCKDYQEGFVHYHDEERSMTRWVPEWLGK